MFCFRTQCFQNNTWDVLYQASYNSSNAYYNTHVIITCGLYTFYPIFDGQKGAFCKILTLCMVSIQECFFVNHLIPFCRRSVHSPLVIVATLVCWITSVLVQTRRAKVRGRDPIIGCSAYKVSSHIKTNILCLFVCLCLW
jgi:hypothetical protein